MKIQLFEWLLRSSRRRRCRRHRPCRSLPSRSGSGETRRSFGGRRKRSIPTSGSVISSAAAGAQTLASGFARLDAELPDGGWPRGALSELLLAHPGVGEMRLLAPALVATQRDGRLVMLFDPPAALAAAALAVARLRRRRAARRRDPCATRSWQRWLVGARAGVEERPRRRHRRVAAAAPARRAVAPAPARGAPPRRRRLRPSRSGGGGAADRGAVARCVARRWRRSRPAARPEAARAALETPLELELPSVLSATARRRSANGKHRRLPAATFVDVA
jgi:protein ImuA